MSYYYAGPTRLAMRTGGQAAVTFIADHRCGVNQLVGPYGTPLAGEQQLTSTKAPGRAYFLERKISYPDRLNSGLKNAVKST